MRPEGVVVNRILESEREREREKPLFENWEDLCSPDGDAVAGPDTQRGMGTRFTVGANYRASRALANLPRVPPDDKAASVHQTMELILVKPPLVPMATSNTPNLDAGGAFIRKCREKREFYSEPVPIGRTANNDVGKAGAGKGLARDITL
ncbi:hypothetical protein TNIN_479661 [Trichonephila inaurata madagascariensis]|uniref:Uncharacterized protein n=1 Tax=Trichonephila inaurata madagascariensis TaxID=2747483 RepID=A0A8X6WXH7_9ARAC|nr:hypothetical protein TNIN_479661 [Trichonephila inaurata madagascariensis]